jgi:photosystem II stability/assembly factor-like uncharacterized protein
MKKFAILFLFFYTLTNSNAFSQWIIQTSRTSNDLYSVSFANSNTGWSVGINGTIVKSTNGGIDWNNQISGTNNLLLGVQFFDSMTGWAVGDSGKILKTIDGGENWQFQPSGTSNILRSVFFINSQTGWAAGDTGTVLKTTNGGINWTFQTGVNSNNLNSIRFINENTGWIACSQAVYKTTNGGINWVLNYNSIRNLVSIFFIDDNTGWVTGNVYTIMKSTDGGMTWNNQISAVNGKNDSPPGVYTSVYFIDANTGWYTSAHSFGGSIYKTSNGGDNWTMDFPTTQNRKLYTINFNSSGFGWAAGEAGTILRGSLLTGISNNGNIAPNKFSLSQNYPNPFNPTTNIKYQITHLGGSPTNSNLVILKIFDALGKEVATLVNEKQSPGTYEVKWNGAQYPSGVYFYKLSAGDFVETKKMLMIK